MPTHNKGHCGLYRYHSTDVRWQYDRLCDEPSERTLFPFGVKRNFENGSRLESRRWSLRQVEYRVTCDLGKIGKQAVGERFEDNSVPVIYCFSSGASATIYGT